MKYFSITTFWIAVITFSLYYLFGRMTQKFSSLITSPIALEEEFQINTKLPLQEKTILFSPVGKSREISTLHQDDQQKFLKCLGVFLIFVVIIVHILV